MPAFESLSLWQNALIFLLSGAVVWKAGERLAHVADALADRTGLGHAFIGALLLGGVTSLPEGATTTSASLLGNAPLAVNNIFGGIALQVTVLAAADLVKPGAALTAEVRRPDVILQGALLVFVLAVAATGIVVGDTLVAGVGLWATAVFVASVAAFFVMHASRERATWEPAGRQAPLPVTPAGASLRDRPTPRLLGHMAVAAVVIAGAGYLLALSADGLAIQTGLGANFVGATLVAVATSLPEVSTTISAVRMGAYSLAVAGIFGANILDAAILLLADLVYPGPAVLNEVGTLSTFSALLGIILTATFLTGLLTRRRRVVLGVGLDSLLVVLLYVGGIALMYLIR
jgi:cation:H+ antiporter